MELDIINPLLGEIKEMYPKLFLSISKCKHIIEEKENILVPEAEVAYLATHIGGAVIQKEERSIVKKYRVVLACMYGIGASQLLVSNIEQHFKNIDIIRVISIIDYKMDRTDFEDVDLLISTVEMDEGTIPCIVVNPVLRDQDVEKIKNYLLKYNPSHYQAKKKLSGHLKEKFKVLKRYNEIMTSILTYYSYENKVSAENMSELIHYASVLLSENESETHKLRIAFETREEKGSTILSKKGMILLHCRADIEKEVCMKIIQLDGPITIGQGENQLPIQTIVLMVGPPLGYDQKVLDVLSELSKAIITSTLSDMIIEGQQVQVEEEIGRVLEKYYEKQVQTL